MSLWKKMRGMVRSALRGEKVLTCGEALENLFEYIDEELDPAMAQRVRDHLEVCAPCANRADFEQAFLEAIASAAQAGEPVPESVRSRVLAALDQADAESRPGD